MIVGRLPPGVLRDRFEAMPTAELRQLQMDNPLWREVRAAAGVPEHRRLH